MKQLMLAGLVIFLATLLGCQKNQTNSSITNLLQGSAVLYNANLQIVNDNTNTTVTVQNAGTSTTVPVKSDGTFQLPILKVSGVLTIAYSHAGYGTYKQFYAQSAMDSIVKGFTQIQPVNLFPTSPVIVNSLSSTRNNDTVTVVCNVSVANRDTLNAIRFFVQKGSPIGSYNNFISTQNVTKPFSVTNGNNIIQICTPCEKECGFRSGDTLYLKAFGDVGNINVSNKYGSFGSALYSYTDATTNYLCFPCVNPNNNSSSISFVIP